jgi:hypothetical protein
MIASYIRRILKLRPLMGDMVVSATGCFALTRGFRLVASRQERPGARSFLRADGRSTIPLTGFGAAIFLLAFVASEAAATILAFHR